MKKHNKRQRIRRKKENNPRAPRKAGSLPRELAHKIRLSDRILVALQKRVLAAVPPSPQGSEA